MAEEAKKAASRKAVDEALQEENMVLGIGSGSTIVYAVERIAEKYAAGLKIKACVPSSFQATSLILGIKVI